MRIITCAIQFILPYPFQSRHQEKRFAKKPGNHSNFSPVLNFLPFLIFIAISCYILFFIFVSIVFSAYLFILLHYLVFIFHFLCIFFLNFLQKTLAKTRSMPYNISCRCGRYERNTKPQGQGNKIDIGVWLSLARAPGLGPGGRRFESCHPDTYAGVVQW